MQMELRNEGPEELLKNQDSSELHSPVNIHLKQLRVKYLYPDDIAATCIEAKTRTNLPEMILRISSREDEEPNERSLCFGVKCSVD